MCINWKVEIREELEMRRGETEGIIGEVDMIGGKQRGGAKREEIIRSSHVRKLSRQVTNRALPEGIVVTLPILFET